MGQANVVGPTLIECSFLVNFVFFYILTFVMHGRTGSQQKSDTITESLVVTILYWRHCITLFTVYCALVRYLVLAMCRSAPFYINEIFAIRILTL